MRPWTRHPIAALGSHLRRVFTNARASLDGWERAANGPSLHESTTSTFNLDSNGSLSSHAAQFDDPARSIRWKGLPNIANSTALRTALLERAGQGRRPVRYLSSSAEVGLRTERAPEQLWPEAEAFGLQELRGKMVREMSSGERQRLRLAIALRGQAQEVALDEPTRHLDPSYVNVLTDLLKARSSTDEHLLVADIRQTLDSSLFDLELGEEPVPSSAPMVGGRGQGPVLNFDIPSPAIPGAASNQESFTVSGGSLVVLWGPNGSGKTSILRNLFKARGRHRVGFSRQDLELQVFASSPRREVTDVLRFAPDGPAWLKDVIGAAPHGESAMFALIEMLGAERWLDDSSGQVPLGALALFGVAVSLWLGEDLVLLDEPSQGLDLALARRLASALCRMADNGARIVVATHDEELVAVADTRWNVLAGRWLP